MLLFRRNALASCPRPAHTDRPTVLVDVCIDERLAEPGACMTVLTLFAHTVEAIRQGRLIERISSTDKEFHFQNWFAARLRETQLVVLRYDPERCSHECVASIAGSPCFSGFPLDGMNAIAIMWPAARCHKSRIGMFLRNITE